MTVFCDCIEHIVTQTMQATQGHCHWLGFLCEDWEQSGFLGTLAERGSLHTHFLDTKFTIREYKPLVVLMYSTYKDTSSRRTNIVVQLSNSRFILVKEQYYFTVYKVIIIS